jgi:hypothetical protein
MSEREMTTVGGNRSGGRNDTRAPRQWIYRNLTPWRIHACFTAKGELLPRGEKGAVVKVLSIPALGEVTVRNEDARDLNTLEMRRLGQIDVRPAPSEFWTHLPRAIVMFGWLFVALFFGAWALFFGGASSLPWAWLVAAVALVPVLALLVATARELSLYVRFRRYREDLYEAELASRARCESGAPVPQSLEGVQRGSRIRTFVDGMPRHAAEVAVLIGAIVVSVFGLGVAIHLTTQLNELLPLEYGAIVQLDDPFTGVSELARNSPAFWQLVVGHVAQWVLVSVAALAPAAMYFQFDRQRLASVQRRWVQEVFRLDPTVRTVGDIEAKYGSQIEASFGEPGPDSGLRLGSGRRSPVIVATILLVVGWFLVISTTQVPDLVESTAGGRTQLVWPSSSDGGEGWFPVPSFFRPDLTLVGYGFLGAYVFTLFHVLRGYQRRDLHPKAYNTVVVRILSAYVLSLVVGVFYDGPYAELTMFFVGFMPQSALVWMREKLSTQNRIARLIPLDEPAPLTDLEGIDLYDRTRLAEEGINNVESLAHADIVDLMSSTRIPAAELVDWTDQAILYLRVGGDAHARSHRDGRRDESEPEPEPDSAAKITSDPEADLPVAGRPPKVRDNLCHLRSFGIRTATDLLQVYEQALRRGRGSNSEASEVALLRDALELPSAPDRTRLRTIQTIIDTLPDEEWFVQVRNWRSPEFGAVDAWYSYLDGHDWTLQRSPLPPRVERAKSQFRSIPMDEATTQERVAS